MSSKPSTFSVKSFLLGVVAAIAAIAGAAAVAAAVLHGPLHRHHAQSPSANTKEVARVRADVAALGNQWNAAVKAKTAMLYAPLHRQHNNSGIRRTSDVRYGTHPQQTLDLFVPDQDFEALGPVVIFLHEDATGGDKIVSGTDDLLYSNVGRWVARFGGVGLNANYRLLPEGAGLAGAEDVRLLIEWARTNVRQHGGDPDSIIIMGNGDGALHVASYLFNESSQLAGGPGVAGAVLGSGAFGSAADMPLSLVDSYQGKAVPILMWSAEFASAESGVAEMKDKLCQKYGKCPMYTRLMSYNHVSPMMSLDSADSAVADVIIRFYHSVVHK